jgi:short-subunit dehydrogenase
MASKSFKTAILVGASSGIGAAMAIELAAQGTHVAILGRRADALDGVKKTIEEAGGRCEAVVHDVTDFKTIPPLFDKLVQTLGGLDLLAYCAGVMPDIAEHEYAFEKDRFMVDVNLLGAMAWMNPAAAYMESKQSGIILGVSSIAGERGRRQNPAYCTSKAGLSTYLESLRNRIHRYGVNVVTIKPGFVRTRMTEGMGDLLWIISAEKAAKIAIAKARKGPKNVFVPARWAMPLFIIRNIPSLIFRRLNI